MLYQRKFKLWLSGSLVLLMSMNCFAGFIPNNNNNTYYKLGGGQSIPAPAFTRTYTVPLNAGGDMALNYDCGLFNPKLSIANSLNQIKNSFENVEQSVVNNATSAIAEFPMYLLARANPTLYDLFNNGLAGAREDLSVSTKACQVMQNEIATGKNPYTDWGTIAMGDDWKYHMSLAPLSGASNNADINQVKQNVEQDAGKNGVSWVQGVSTVGGIHAGGQGQPPIHVVNDTSIAGYNAILQNGRPLNDKTPPSKTNDNAGLVDTFASPQDAADWIANVVGDKTITTYNKGKKGSTPGVGLLPQNQGLTIKISKKLADLVASDQPATLKELQAVSSPSVKINQSVINAIRNQPTVMQSIYVNKLAEQVATARTINKAFLAKRILTAGQQVPAIYGNAAAQKSLTHDLNRLDQGINNLLFYVKANKLLVSNMASVLVQVNHQKQLDNAAIRTAGENAATLQNGALKQKENRS